MIKKNRRRVSVPASPRTTGTQNRATHAHYISSIGHCVPGISWSTASANSSMAGLVCSNSLMSVASSWSYRPSQFLVILLVKSSSIYDEEDHNELSRNCCVTVATITCHCNFYNDINAVSITGCKIFEFV